MAWNVLCKSAKGIAEHHQDLKPFGISGLIECAALCLGFWRCDVPSGHILRLKPCAPCIFGKPGNRPNELPRRKQRGTIKSIERPNGRGTQPLSASGGFRSNNNEE